MKIKYKKYWRKTGLKQTGVGDFVLNHIKKKNSKFFLEVGVFHGVTSRNVCELLYYLHGYDFKFTGIDLFLSDNEILSEEFIPNTKFSNFFKKIYWNYIARSNPYSMQAVFKLLKKFKNNINIIKGDSNKVLKEISLDEFDYVLLDGGHRYETVKNDLESLTKVINNKGTVLCDDYNLSYAPGVKKAIDEYVLNKNFKLKILCSRFAELTK